MKREQFETENFLGLYLWLALIIISLMLYFCFPEIFSPRNIRQFFNSNVYTGLSVFFLLASLRGFTFIPLTPLLLAGILVFPAWPLFFVNLGGILVSSALVYYLSRYFRFDNFFHKHYPEQITQITQLLQKRELPVITVWGIAPFLPTDLIVYVCSVVRISSSKTLLGVLLGESIICALYIFGGEPFLNFIL
jgi:uncharacterized membrane protein YdjX (TVP38/TMEM64 family)